MVKIKPYHYLISFTHYYRQTNMFFAANIGLDRERPINNIKDIRDIEKSIESENNLESVVITNFIPLKKGCQREGDSN